MIMIKQLPSLPALPELPPIVLPELPHVELPQVFSQNNWHQCIMCKCSCGLVELPHVELPQVLMNGDLVISKYCHKIDYVELPQVLNENFSS